jgi:hypothetical protein
MRAPQAPWFGPPGYVHATSNRKKGVILAQDKEYFERFGLNPKFLSICE